MESRMCLTNHQRKQAAIRRTRGTPIAMPTINGRLVDARLLLSFLGLEAGATAAGLVVTTSVVRMMVVGEPLSPVVTLLCMIVVTEEGWEFAAEDELENIAAKTSQRAQCH